MKNDKIYPGSGLVPVLIYNNKIYICLLISSENKNQYEISKGGLDLFDKSYETSALREAEEEIGYFHDPKNELKQFYNIKGGIKVFYTIVRNNRNKKPSDPFEEVSGIIWINIDDSIKYLPDWQKPIIIKLKKILKNI